ncbi:hypothetical protein ACUOCP_38235, partial [Escherichia sp. R-CC3]
KLPDGQRETLQSRMPQDLPPVLAEPHRRSYPSNGDQSPPYPACRK